MNTNTQNTIASLGNTSADNVMVKSYKTGDKASGNGNRLSKITFKTDRNTKIKPPSKCAELELFKPAQIRDAIDSLIPAISNMLESTPELTLA